MSAASPKTTGGKLKRGSAVVCFVAVACGPGVESTDDGLSTSETSGASSTSSGATGFAEACDLGPGWIADEMLRAKCSEWLEGHCAERTLSDCPEAFITTDQRQFSCFVANVVVADGQSCAPPEARCLPGNETEIYRCNFCGAEEKNLESLELTAGTREIVIMDGDQCGTDVFIAEYAPCSPDDTACACGCSS